MEESTQNQLQQLRDQLRLSLDPMSRHLYEKVGEILQLEDTKLDLLGFKHGTDKSSLIDDENGVRLGHDYLRHYEFFFDRYRERQFSMVEFGCFRGQSLRMWKEFFPRAEIYGVDLDEGAKAHEESRIHVVIGDATKSETYDALKRELHGASPYIIIDDASHAWGDQRISLELFWQMLAPSGFYVIEDLECGATGAYSRYPPAVLDSQPFFDYIRDMCALLRWSPRRRTYVMQDREFSQLPDRIKKLQMTLDECYFVPGAVILHKNPIKPPWER